MQMQKRSGLIRAKNLFFTHILSRSVVLNYILIPQIWRKQEQLLDNILVYD